MSPEDVFEAVLSILETVAARSGEELTALYGRERPSAPYTLLAWNTGNRPPPFPLTLSAQDAELIERILPPASRRSTSSLHLVEQASSSSSWHAETIPLPSHLGVDAFFVLVSPKRDNLEPCCRTDLVRQLAPVVSAGIELLKQRERLETLPIIVFELDREGTVTFATSSLAHLTRSPDTLGRRIDELLPSYPTWSELLEHSSPDGSFLSRDLLLATETTLLRAHVWLRPHLDPSGQVSSYTVSLLPQPWVPYPSARSFRAIETVTDSSALETIQPLVEKGRLSAFIIDFRSTCCPGALDSESVRWLFAHLIDRLTHMLNPLAVRVLSGTTLMLFFPHDRLPELLLRRQAIAADLTNRFQTLLSWPFHITFTVQVIADADDLLDELVGHIDPLSQWVHIESSPSLSILHPGEILGAVRPIDVLNALRERSFAFALQPIAALREGIPERRELLARLRVGSHILPAAQIFQHNMLDTLVAEIDAAAFELALALVQRERQVVHVNLSLQSLLHPVMQQLLERSDTLSGLVIEVVEGWSLATDLVLARDILQELHERGAHIALDDVGAGPMSLNLWHLLPLSAIKFDGSLVRRLVDEPRARAVARELTRAAHALGLEVVAEHVEDEETLAILREIGVDFAQGFLIGRPVLLDKVP